MQNEESITDADLIAQFEAGTLPLESFRHRHHVRVVYLYLNRYPVWEVLGRFSRTLTSFAAAHGRANLYHETITWAYILIIRERMVRADRLQSWPEFADQNPDLFNWPDSILKKYYRDETLRSEFARTTFVFPDRADPSQ